MPLPLDPFAYLAIVGGGVLLAKWTGVASREGSFARLSRDTLSNTNETRYLPSEATPTSLPLHDRFASLWSLHEAVLQSNSQTKKTDTDEFCPSREYLAHIRKNASPKVHRDSDHAAAVQRWSCGSGFSWAAAFGGAARCSQLCRTAMNALDAMRRHEKVLGDVERALEKNKDALAGMDMLRAPFWDRAIASGQVNLVADDLVAHARQRSGTQSVKTTSLSVTPVLDLFNDLRHGINTADSLLADWSLSMQNRPEPETAIQRLVAQQLQTEREIHHLAISHLASSAELFADRRTQAEAAERKALREAQELRAQKANACREAVENLTAAINAHAIAVATASSNGGNGIGTAATLAPPVTRSVCRNADGTEPISQEELRNYAAEDLVLLPSGNCMSRLNLQRMHRRVDPYTNIALTEVEANESSSSVSARSQRSVAPPPSSLALSATAATAARTCEP